MKLPDTTPPRWSWLEQRARKVVTDTLRDLPRDVRSAARRCLIVFEHRPDAADLAEGVEPDTLGYFEGACSWDETLFPPPRLRLWLENLWDFANGNPKDFDLEVRVTLLHELGHFLGLDEDDLEARGLD